MPPETMWPCCYAGTMRLVMRDGINPLRHAKRYSSVRSAICVSLARARLAREAIAKLAVTDSETSIPSPDQKVKALAKR